MDSLPNEVLALILREVPCDQTLTLRLVSRRLNMAVIDDAKRRFPEIIYLFNAKQFVKVSRLLHFVPDYQRRILDHCKVDSTTVVARCIDFGWIEILRKAFMSDVYAKRLLDGTLLRKAITVMAKKRNIEGLRLIYQTCRKHKIAVMLNSDRALLTAVRTQRVDVIELMIEYKISLVRIFNYLGIKNIMDEVIMSGNCRILSIFMNAGYSVTNGHINHVTNYNYLPKYSEMYTLLTNKKINVKNLHNLNDKEWPSLGR